MWIVTTLGFFSIVRKPEDVPTGTLTVRARVKSDLQALKSAHLPTLSAIETDTGTDYPYRARAPQGDVAAALAALTDGIDYSNFKDAVRARQGKARADVYGKLWSVLHDLQTTLSTPTSRTGAARPAARPSPGTHAASAVPRWDIASTPRTTAGAPELPTAPPATSYGGVLIDDEGRVLLVEPANHFGGYAWTFPKGRPNAGEAPARAALREVREETGYEATILDVLPGVYAGTETKTAYFVMQPRGAPGAHDAETARVTWATFDEAPALIAQTKTAAGRRRDLAILADVRAWWGTREGKA